DRLKPAVGWLAWARGLCRARGGAYNRVHFSRTGDSLVPDAGTSRTLGELRAAGYRVLPVREEMRKNLLARLGRAERILPGIIGFDDTVIPAIAHAVLAGPHMVFLGERGQA